MSQELSLKYPIVLVHGIFTKDGGFHNSWGGLPQYLMNHGNKVFFGRQNAVATIEDNAKILADNIEKIAKENGGKVNIFAHSKGGLEARYAISCLGIDKYVASLTTFNTPHNGCEIIDFAVKNWPNTLKQMIYKGLNIFSKFFFKEKTDSEVVLKQLGPTFCHKFNTVVKDKKNVLYQSVSSIVRKYKLKHFLCFPLQPIIRKFSKNNDGLITTSSEQWGENFIIINKNTDISLAHDESVKLPKHFKNTETYKLLNNFYISLIGNMVAIGL